MDKWQPINTAPKDGLKILFFPIADVGRFALQQLIRVDTDTRYGYRKATHWMPLPEPPTEAS